MGGALGWIAVALAGVTAAPPTENTGQPVQIAYSVRMVETQGVGWRERVFSHLKPVTRRRAATVWTASRSAAQQLVDEFSKCPDSRILQAPRVTVWSGAPATVQHRRNQSVIVQAAWNGQDSAPRTEPEKLRVGWHTTMVGRKLDQGILVRVVFEDTVIRAVHHVSVNRTGLARCSTSGTPAKEESCTGLATNSDRMPIGRAAFGVNGCCEGKSTEPKNCCQPGSIAGKDDSIQKVVLDVPEIDNQEVLGEWLVPNGEVLLISFGAHTVADKNGMAVVKERLAFIEADEAAAAPIPGANRENPAPVRVPGPQALDFVVPPPAIASPVQGNVSIVPTLPPVRLATPAIPSRSIPQGIHADGTAADLPPISDSESGDDTSSSESSEPMPSPQSKKAPQPKPTPTTDKGTKKVGFTLPEAAAVLLPNLFPPGGSTEGVQIMLPMKSLSVDLPFHQKLEIEVTGKVVPNTDSK